MWPARRATAPAPATSPGPRRRPQGRPYPPGTGRCTDGPDQLAEADRPGHWEMNPETGIARRTEKLASTELETCAACHSRRKVIAKNPSAGRALPRRLPAGAARARPLSRRWADRRRGLRIRLVPAEPHACRRGHLLDLPRPAQREAARRAAMRSARNAICRRNSTRPSIIITSPAAPARSASTAICRRRPTWSSTRGAITASAFRVPILSVSLGTPNACTQCHADRPAEWAAETVAGWYPGGRQTTPHYGTALHAGRVGAADAEQQLDRLILDRASRRSRGRAPCRCWRPMPRPPRSRR